MVSGIPSSSREEVDVESGIEVVGKGSTEMGKEEGKQGMNGKSNNNGEGGEWRMMNGGWKGGGGGREEEEEEDGGQEEEGRGEEEEFEEEDIDYVRRGQWLRAAVLGANDGLVSTASLMMGVGANYEKAGAMIVAGLAGLVGGACSMAIGEFVSVYTQRDAEKCHAAAAAKTRRRKSAAAPEEEVAPPPPPKAAAVGPSPWEASAASAASFALGSAVPLLSAGFIAAHLPRLLIMLAVSSAALAGLGSLSARLSGARPLPGAARVLLAGWLAMLLTFSLLRLFSVVV